MNNKIVTFSFDDGIQYDAKLVELLNKYNLKCTFNINTGLIYRSHEFARGPEPIEVHRLFPEEMKKIYVGHEIASHSLTHPRLETLTVHEMETEIREDIENIKSIFGLSNVPCFAYPYGTYSEEVIEVLKKYGIKFARGTHSSKGFGAEGDLLEYRPSAYYRDEDLEDIVDEFLNLKTDKKAILYIWGHSYEPEGYKEWDKLETIFKKLANRKDIDYLTNGEAFFNDDSAVYKG
ncbi:MAG: polysaccharide deacetylase family protein [Bacilli bacterium]|nr:polysaccharide deacetylase family protein [Bacilli bacterium]